MEREALVVEVCRPRGLAQLTGRRHAERREAGDPEPLPPTPVPAVGGPGQETVDPDAPTERIPVVPPVPAATEQRPTGEPEQARAAPPGPVRTTQRLPVGWYDTDPAEQ
ncbi:hypothetical protein [Umezawaea beigongshangensis]|uniref:hypothetical protein n=1 Tax=Umezawaea beigongshangensis TaxID=2780383 RepID=UPI0018F1C063|nr:hypothetical protein [Umezawaea beigongshangensis]